MSYPACAAFTEALRGRISSKVRLGSLSRLKIETGLHDPPGIQGVVSQILWALHGIQYRDPEKVTRYLDSQGFHDREAMS